MPDVFFDNPPVLQGDEKTQLKQLSGYLYTISSKLNEALMTVSMQEKQAEAEAAAAKSKTAGGSTTEISQEYKTLKSLIIKTAEIVRTEMDELSTQLHSETQAISMDFGRLESSLDATIRATAEGVLQDYHYEETVQDVLSNTSYRTMTNQYIFTGKIHDNPVEYGIAIGEGVTQYDANGNAQLNEQAKCATFTMNKMSFWQGNVELAYFASGKFYISKGEITDSLQIGNFEYKAMADGSMALIKA